MRDGKLSGEKNLCVCFWWSFCSFVGASKWVAPPISKQPTVQLATGHSTLALCFDRDSCGQEPALTRPPPIPDAHCRGAPRHWTTRTSWPENPCRFLDRKRRGVNGRLCGPTSRPRRPKLQESRGWCGVQPDRPHLAPNPWRAFRYDRVETRFLRRRWVSSI